MKTPFTKAHVQMTAGFAEFVTFRCGFRQAVRETAATIPRFADLNGAFRSRADTDAFTAQFTFLRRTMMARGLKGEEVEEIGATLLYSIGPTGLVVCALYPVKSDVARVKEDMIILSKGLMSAHQLRRRLSRDLRDLVAYTNVTSVEAEATLGESLRVWWIRFVRTKKVDDKDVPGIQDKALGYVLRFSWTTIVTSLSAGIGRQVGLIIVIWLLLRYAPSLVSWISAGAVVPAHPGAP